MATITKAEYSPEDLLEIHGRSMPELVDGELLERNMGQKSDSIAATCLILIGVFVRQHRLGLVNGAQGSYQVFPDAPTKVRIPDVSFTRRERVPQGGPADGHAKVAPDLVVEVVSTNDNAEDVHQKVNDFLAAGIPLIWVVYPGPRDVLVRRPGGIARFLGIGDVPDGEDILPGFRLEIASIFE